MCVYMCVQIHFEICLQQEQRTEEELHGWVRQQEEKGSREGSG